MGGKEGIDRLTHRLTYPGEVEKVKRVEERGRRREKNSREHEDVCNDMQG